MLSLALLLAGCAGHAERTKPARTALDAMQPKAALALLNEELEVDNAEQLPSEVGGDNTLLILDRAMVLQQLDQYELSSRDLQIGDKQVEILDFSRNALHDIGKYMFSDSTGPYKAPAYEKLMLNTMNMVNYLVRADLDGARIEARRLAVMQKFIKDHQDPAASLSGPGSYLAGFVFEKSGRPQEALRYYDEALQYGSYQSLVDPIRRLAEQASYRSPRINQILRGTRPPRRGEDPSGEGPQLGATPPAAEGGAAAAQESSTQGAATKATGAAAVKPAAQTTAAAGNDTSAGAAGNMQAAEGQGGERDASADQTTAQSEAPSASGTDQSGEILVIVSFGRVPAKRARRIPIGLALTFASDFISPYDRARANRLALQGLVTWVNFPELGKPRGTWGQPAFALNRSWQRLEGILAVDRACKRVWDESKGALVASAITRMLSRVAAGEVVRRASDDSILGFLLSLGTQATLTAADTPDTRSWATLPARIAFGRVRVAPGTHTVVLRARGIRKRQRVRIKPGGWSVVALTVLH